MNYVEWLRVRNCLRVVAIVLAILVALAVVLRISVARYMSPAAWVEHLAAQPGVSVRHVVLPGGVKRTILDQPSERTHIVIDDRGASGTHIVITEPSGRAHHEAVHANMGSISVMQSPRGDMTTTVVDTNGAVPIIYYMLFADLVALIVATILAAPLAREIDGHLEIALMKPCSRPRYAWGAIGAGVAGIVAASVMTVVACYLCQLLFQTPRLDFGGINARAIVMGLAMPLAWYAMLCAATSWLHRAYGAVLGFAWPVALLVAGLAALRPNNTVTLFIHDVAWVLSRLDPLSYVRLAGPSSDATISYAGADFPQRLGVIVLMFVVYGGLAAWQWWRVEA